MLKVVHLLPTLNYGGTERAVLNLCRFSRQTEPSVFALMEGPFLNEFRRANIPVIIKPVFSETNLSKEIRLNNYERVRTLLLELKNADIVNLHVVTYSRTIHTFVKLSAVPHVITLQWPSVLPRLDYPVICASHWIRALQKEENHYIVIHNGVDLSQFVYKPKTPREKVIIVRVCRPERCASYFWSAIERVVDLCPQVEVWIIGEEGNSTSRVKFLGIRRDIPDLLSQADIFAYTPRPGEGAHDNSVLEAMAMGVPSVLSDVECVRESIRSGEEGFLVPFGDEADFTQALMTLITNPVLRATMARNAMRTVKERFDASHTALRYEEVYFSLLKEKKG